MSVDGVQATLKRNFPEHRYKLGKQDRGIGLAEFTNILNTVDVLNAEKNHYVRKYDVDKIKSVLACFYWTGARKTEIVGGRAKRYFLPPCERHALPIEKHSKKVEGVLKENITVDAE